MENDTTPMEVVNPSSNEECAKEQSKTTEESVETISTSENDNELNKEPNVSDDGASEDVVEDNDSILVKVEDSIICVNDTAIIDAADSITKETIIHSESTKEDKEMHSEKEKHGTPHDEKDCEMPKNDGGEHQEMPNDKNFCEVKNHGATTSDKDNSKAFELKATDNESLENPVNISVTVENYDTVIDTLSTEKSDKVENSQDAKCKTQMDKTNVDSKADIVQDSLPVHTKDLVESIPMDEDEAKETLELEANTSLESKSLDRNEDLQIDKKNELISKEPQETSFNDSKESTKVEIDLEASISEETECFDKNNDFQETKEDGIGSPTIEAQIETKTGDSSEPAKKLEETSAESKETNDSNEKVCHEVQKEATILNNDEKVITEKNENKSEQVLENEPVAKKLRLSTGEKKDSTDEEVSNAEKSEEVSAKNEGQIMAEKQTTKDEDIVLVECGSKNLDNVSEKDSKIINKDSTSSIEKVENDDVMVVCTSESIRDNCKTIDEVSSTKDDDSNKDKDISDDVVVVETEDVESKKFSDDIDKNQSTENNNTEVSVKETPIADKESSSDPKAKEKDIEISDTCEKKVPTKHMILDENTGMFEEKETVPEESVPQVFSDSDEDVVMVDNYVTTDRKSASKPAPEPEKPAVEQKTPSTTQQQSKANEQSTPKPKSSSTVSVECINVECKKDTRETAPAPAFALNFFGIPKKTKKQRICLSCYDYVVQKYSDLGSSVLDQQPLLFCDLPRKNELVEISDSSEEEEDEDVKKESEKPLSDDIISLVESELNDIVSNTFEKINISQQIDWTEQIMKQKIEYNTKLSEEINNELNELQRKVDRIHLKLYSKSRPRYQDLPPINIFEVDHNRHSLIQQPIQANRQYSPMKPLSQQQQQQTTQSTTQGTQSASAQSVSPQKEEFTRPPVTVGQFYFAVKHKLLSNWAECQVVEAVTVADKNLYKVNFLYNQGGGSAPIKVVPAKYLAYRHSFNVKLPLGTRVIARFDAGTTQPTGNKSQQNKNSSFYPGIIAESFGKYNRNRYLIFFDDGYAQYVTHGDVRVVCEESKEVWSDIHPHSQEFIKNYLMNYRSQRPMVQVKVGQRIITEWKGKWIYAKVIDIDASLVQLHFPDDNRFEWIYRGSTRLGPLYQEKALSMSKASNNKFSKFQKRNEPSIEYITLDDDDETEQGKEHDSKKASTPQEQALQDFKNLQMNQDSANNRSVAKKSTFHRPTPTSQPSAVFMNSSTIYCEDDRPKGKIVYYTAKKHLPPLKYKPHECNPNCLFKITHNLKSYSPLAKPLLSGWERQLCKMKYKKVFVVYRAPCGRRVRNMYELHMYLRMTKATLNVENFDFDPMIHCLAEYVIENHIYHNPDLSDGKEFMAVPCVNYFDDTKPPPCIYSTERIPTEGVNLNLDSDFLCGCDCEDDCIDKSRCQCWQLTIAGAKFGNPNTPIDNIGYVYKRLQEPVVTGIYECNSRCKCKSNCLNRVVQHPLMTKLQVFKTSNRGWGIRCLNDVAKGSFICIYSGHLLTEEAGNMICQMNENKAGDEYFADLDYIETVEQLKEGYETDVVESDSELDSDEPDYDAQQDSGASDDDFTSKSNPSDTAVKTRSQVRRDSRTSSQKIDSKSDKKPVKKREDTKTGSDDEREMVNLMPNSDMTKEDAPSPAIKYRSVRKYFGKHEQIYIMDAKKSGNLGRYFNHSCNPNLFVQNVFVDTHDLRFPWVAFFALSNVRAGSELTWNYNYDVGSVPGKVLYCQCGAENCRQRLL